MPDGDLEKMRASWNVRARKDHRYYIACTVDGDADGFVASGARDCRLFFEGLEHLLRPETTAVDIGCGAGRIDYFIAPKVGRLIGVDVSAEMVALARKQLSGMDNCEFRVVSGASLDGIPSDSIDLVFSHVVFQHIPKRFVQSYVVDVLRVLKPGGDFVFQVPNNADGPVCEPPDSDSWELRHYEEDEMRVGLETIGFKWIGCIKVGISDVPASFRYLRVHVVKPG